MSDRELYIAHNCAFVIENVVVVVDIGTKIIKANYITSNQVMDCFVIFRCMMVRMVIFCLH